MCGLAGILNVNQGRAPVSKSLLESMIATLHHRGPDGYGFYVGGQVGLGHARLSIIDLDTGDQPIANEDGSIQVVFNGEIFNYVELRRDLIARGHRFKTQSDTEVIVHLYEERGIDFVQELNGQFAIALWDSRHQRLVLTRDRPGILPLYYTQEEGRIVFGSEIKAILPALVRRPGLDLHALDQILTFWAPVSPRTAFERIFELSPGTQLVAENGRIRLRRYWEWSFAHPGEYLRGPIEDQADQARNLLQDATRIRLRADVPVGAYLSGGLDSSALTALIHGHSGDRLRTFSIEFADTELDESVHQRSMIEHLGSDHTSVRCTNDDIALHFPGVVAHTESPILRTAPVPMHLLSGLAQAQHYKVVLTGEGADEVFGGYDLFKETKLREFWSRQPESKIRPLLLKRLYPYLDLAKNQDPAYLKRFFGVGVDNPEHPLFSHLTRAANTAHIKLFYSEKTKSQLLNSAEQALIDSLPDDFYTWSCFNRAQFLEAKTMMPGYLLASQGDRMLMSHSVEGRFPYLDHRVIEFANRLDPRLKMRVLDEKYLLKRAVEDCVPRSIRQRFKQPYRAPDIAAFFSGPEREYVTHLLQPSSIDQAGYFDGAKVHRLLKKINSGRAGSNRDNMAFVGILSTQIWHELFVKNRQIDATRAPPAGRGINPSAVRV